MKFVDAVREPDDNVYGRYRVLRRVDGAFVLHSGEPGGPVFGTEADARRAAERASGLPAREIVDHAAEFRRWMAGRSHTAACRCKKCRA